MTTSAISVAVEASLEAALIEGLRNSEIIAALLGQPARLFPEPPAEALFPYAVIERHQRRPHGASRVRGDEHRIDIAVYTREGGRCEARMILDALSRAIEDLTVLIADRRVILMHTVYSDTMRTPSRKAFRGLLRLRLLTEEIDR